MAADHQSAYTHAEVERAGDSEHSINVHRLIRQGSNESSMMTYIDRLLPWAHSGPLQTFFGFISTLKVFNDLGNLLLAQRLPGRVGRSS